MVMRSRNQLTQVGPSNVPNLAQLSQHIYTTQSRDKLAMLMQI